MLKCFLLSKNDYVLGWTCKCLKSEKVSISFYFKTQANSKTQSIFKTQPEKALFIEKVSESVKAIHFSLWFHEFSSLFTSGLAIYFLAIHWRLLSDREFLIYEFGNPRWQGLQLKAALFSRFHVTQVGVAEILVKLLATTLLIHYYNISFYLVFNVFYSCNLLRKSFP